jgi:hypothetical protein
MKNSTKHFLKRWVERVIGITTEKERDEYISTNKEMIEEHANKTFKFAQFLYKGQIGDNVTRNYHIKDNLIFVTNTTDDAFITIYEVDLGFTDELNATVRKGLVEEIKKLTTEKEEIEFKIELEVEEIYHKADSIEEQIKIMKEQVANMEKERDFYKQEAKAMKSKSLNTGLDLRRYTLMLVNSKEYKKDLTTMK